MGSLHQLKRYIPHLAQAVAAVRRKDNQTQIIKLVG